MFAQVAAGTRDDSVLAIEAAAAAFPSWSRTTVAERKQFLVRILEEYMARRSDVARALERELGAPHAFAEIVQANMFPMHFKAAIALADTYAWTEDVGRNTVIFKEPVGVVGAITPWNWPLNQIAAKMAPALLAGCTLVLKPSEVTPLNALIVAEAVHAAGLPKGVFNLVNGTGLECGDVLATHPAVDMVSFTGSTAVGRHLHAAGAPTLKRIRTELGGKSATIVLADASTKQIAMMASQVLGNTGQSCNALGRMLAPVEHYERVVEVVKGVFEGATIVDATDASNKNYDPNALGPLASQAQQDKVLGYVQRGIDEGARLVTGGTAPLDGVPAGGYFVRPTVFADVHNDMAIAREEIFGPGKQRGKEVGEGWGNGG